MALRVRPGPAHRQDSTAASAQPAHRSTTLRLRLSSQATASAPAASAEGALVSRIRALQVQGELQELIDSLRSLPNPSESLTSWLESWDLCSDDADELEKGDLIARLILKVLAKDGKANPAVLSMLKTAATALERLLPKEKDLGAFLEEKKAALKDERQRLKEARKAAKVEARVLKLQLYSNREAALIQRIRNIENPEVQTWLEFWDQNSSDLDDEAKSEALAQLILDILVPFFDEIEEVEEITPVIQSALLVLNNLLPERNVSTFLEERLQEKQADQERVLEPFLLMQLQSVEGAIPVLRNWMNDWNQDLDVEDRKILLAFLITKILTPTFEQTGGNSFIFSLNDLARKLLQKMLGQQDLLGFLSEVQKANIAGREDALVENLSDTVQPAANEALSGLMDEFDDARRDSRLQLQQCYQRVAASLKILDTKKQALMQSLADTAAHAEESLSQTEAAARVVFSKQEKVQEGLDIAFAQAIEFLKGIKK